MTSRHAAVSVSFGSDDHDHATMHATEPEGVAAVVAALEQRLGASRFERDFGGAAAVTRGSTGVSIAAGEPAQAEALARRYAPMLQEIGSTLGVAVRVVPGVVRVPLPARNLSAKPVPRSAVALSMPALAGLSVGPGNRLAVDAAVRAARGELPAVGAGAALYLHGSCGVGKTALLQGIVEEAKRLRAGVAARFVAAETFANEFIHACKSDAPPPDAASRMERFKSQYRRCDILCIDDVQALAGKQKTQIELQHVIDVIASRGGRVIIAANAVPRQVQGLSDGLMSRFAAGLVAEVGAPDRETAGRIIAAAAARRGLVIEAPAAAAMVDAAVASSRGSALSIRELEGAVTRVEAVHRLLGAGRIGGGGSGGSGAVSTIGLIAVHAAMGETRGGGSNGVLARLGPSGNGVARRPVRLEQVVEVVCRGLGVTMHEVAGRGRHARVVMARAMATTLARAHTSASYPEIARALGRPNHSTVITAHQRLAKQLAAGESIDLGEGTPMPLTELQKRLSAQVEAGQTRAV